VDTAQDTLSVIKPVGQDMRSISEATGLLGVTVYYLRLAERPGIVPDARWLVGGSRRCTPEDIARLCRPGVGERNWCLAASDE
jgi:hypothetical protein